jgi:radical SAM protein with 4Fe4S-binding SPASM domain
MPVKGDSVWRLTGLARKIDGAGGAVVYRVDTSHWMRLNPSAGLILGLVDGRRDVESIVQELCRQHGFPEGIIREWVTGLFATLTEKGYLEDVAADPVRAVDPGDDKRLDVLYLHVTGRCNFACPYCYASAGRQAPDLDLDLAKTLAARAAELGAKKLAISGGEPLLRGDLEEILQAGKAAGLMTQLLTNGVLLDRERALSVTAHLDMVQVSIDGWNEETNQATRGAGAFDKIRAGLINLRDIGYDRVTAAVTAFTLPEDDIENMIRTASEFGAKVVRFNKLIPSGRASDLDPERYSGERDMRLADAVYAAYTRVQKERTPAEIAAGPNFVVRVAGDPVNEIMSMTRKAFCGVGVSTLSVACDGTVFPCAALHRPELALGNARDEDLGAIQARSAERHVRLSVDHEPQCRGCDVRHYCGGGCRAVNYALTGQLGGRSPHCEVLKRRIDGLLTRAAS